MIVNRSIVVLTAISTPLDSVPLYMVHSSKGGVVPSRWLEDELNCNLGFLVRRDLGLSVSQVL